MPAPRPAVFLDRDDTINRNADLPDEAWAERTPGDLLDADHVHLLPGVIPALKRLRGAGYAIVVITNQGGVARGGGSLDDVDRVNDRLRELLAEDDGDGLPPPLRRSLVDAYYACPFHPAGQVARFADEHAWRKPAPGMIDAAMTELGLDPIRSWMVGDKQRDLDAARAAGIPADRCLLVGAGAALAGLPEAADRILAVPVPARAVQATRVTLRAESTTDLPRLADPRTLETVLAAARGLAERTGIELLDLEPADTSLVAVVGVGRIAAMGFGAELRRITSDWHKRHRGRRLWIEPERDD